MPVLSEVDTPRLVVPRARPKMEIALSAGPQRGPFGFSSASFPLLSWSWQLLRCAPIGAAAPVTPLMTRLGTKFPGFPLLPKVLFQPQQALGSRWPAMAVFLALICACVSPAVRFANAGELK